MFSEKNASENVQQIEFSSDVVQQVEERFSKFESKVSKAERGYVSLFEAVEGE